MVGLIVGHPEMIEGDLHPFEGLVEVVVVAQGKVPRAHSLLLGADHDRRPMVV